MRTSVIVLFSMLVSLPALADLQYTCSNKASLADGAEYTLTFNSTESITLENKEVTGTFGRTGDEGEWSLFKGTFEGKPGPGGINSKNMTIAQIKVEQNLVASSQSGRIEVGSVSYHCQMLLRGN